MSEFTVGCGPNKLDMYPPAKTRPTDINRSAKFCILRAHSVEQSAFCNPLCMTLAAQLINSGGAADHSFIFLNSDERHLAPLWRFCESGAV